MLNEWIGWTGTVLFIASYALLSLNKLRADQFIYQAANALGALCLVINAVYLNDNPNLVVNFIWMGISVYAIIRNQKKKVPA
jgi:hypothetical protein